MLLVKDLIFKTYKSILERMPVITHRINNATTKGKILVHFYRFQDLKTTIFGHMNRTLTMLRLGFTAKNCGVICKVVTHI